MYAKGISGAKFILLSSGKTRGVGHFPFADDAAAFGQAVAEFLDSVESTAGNQDEHKE